MYHWLLLDEDYVFNRQTEIDDADDIDTTKMNSYNTPVKVATTETITTLRNINSNKEIVNDSSNATMKNLQVKKLSTYPSDVVGASTSGPDEQNKVTPTTLASSLSLSTSSTMAKKTTTSNRLQQQQQQQLRSTDEKLLSSTTALSNASRAGVTDEDDTEIIEKFLEKLNININTELILAKRRMRAIMPPISSSFLAATSPSSAESSTESDDYNTLQKMDYYLLYDVWYVQE